MATPGTGTVPNGSAAQGTSDTAPIAPFTPDSGTITARNAEGVAPKRGKAAQIRIARGRVTSVDESASAIIIETPHNGSKTFTVPPDTPISVGGGNSSPGDVDALQAGMMVLVNSRDGKTALAIEAQPRVGPKIKAALKAERQQARQQLLKAQKEAARQKKLRKSFP